MDTKVASHIYLKITLLFFMLWMQNVIFAQKSIPKGFCVSNEEAKLADAINLLRIDYGKPKIQFSTSLSYVAKTHTTDLQINHPDTSICNLSSWSDKGNWTPCCYSEYVHKPKCMWDKPKELTPYPYRGYELVMYFEDSFNFDSVINLLSDSKEALDMLLTRGIYEKKKWMCLGAGISDNYVAIWFGQRKDKLKPPHICKKEKPIVKNTDSLTKEKSNTYYLVFGSYDNLHDAKEESAKIKKDNFDNCDILVKNNRFRVYLNKFDSMKEALFAKQQLPPNYKAAWILKD